MPPRGRSGRRPTGLGRERARLGFRQVDLAIRADVSLRAIAYIEAGDVTPKASTQRKLLGALGLRWEDRRRVFAA